MCNLLFFLIPSRFQEMRGGSCTGISTVSVSFVGYYDLRCEDQTTSAVQGRSTIVGCCVGFGTKPNTGGMICQLLKLRYCHQKKTPTR